MWVDLRQAGHVAAASRLDSAADHGELTDVDYVRVVRVHPAGARRPGPAGAAVAAEIEDAGAHAWLHPSGQRDLPARLGEHDLMTGQVRLGVASGSAKNPATHAGQTFALDAEVLRTSLLVIGPTGSGKTRSFARPIVELLGLQTLTNMASVVVIDPHWRLRAAGLLRRRHRPAGSGLAVGASTSTAARATRPRPPTGWPARCCRRAWSPRPTPPRTTAWTPR